MSTNYKKAELQELYRNAGQANFELGQFQEAFQHFERAYKEDSNALNTFNRGLSLMKLGLYEDAEKDFIAAHKAYSVKDDNAAKEN